MDKIIICINCGSETLKYCNGLCKKCYHKRRSNKVPQYDKNILRQCRECKNFYPQTQEFFSPQKNQKDGIVTLCRFCKRLYHNKYNKEVVRAIPEKKDRLKKNRKEWYYRTNEAEKAKNRCIERNTKDPIWERAKRIRGGMNYHAKIGNLELDKKITSKTIYELIKNIRVCECCGTELDFNVYYNDNSHRRDNLISIDRIDSCGGYVLDNIAFICDKCNVLKRDATIKQLEDIVNYMKRYVK